jgi:hypothetical protein
MRATIAGTALIFSLPSMPTVSGQAAPDAVVLAVATHGVLLPIARRAAGVWVNTWPGSDDDDVPVPPLNEMPHTWLGGRVPTDWTVWFTAGGSARVRVNGSQRYGGCQSPPALKLAAVLSTPRGAFDDVHLGVASTSQRIDAVRALPRNARPAAARAAITTASRRLIGRDDGIAWLYESASGARRAYYYETREAKLHSREWPSLARGWLRRHARGSLEAVGAEIQVCPYDGPIARAHSCLIPLGVLQAADHEIWVMERTEGETHSFELWRISAADAQRILSADAGGC